MPAENDKLLATYLKDRRTRLDPAALGFTSARRRTAGLRREEVAQRANISATWYTWLEQGRGGAPSAAVLERIARALMLTEVEREHLFLLGLGRPPAARYHAAEGVTPRLQRVLDALGASPALIKTATWDIVAWNRAATIVLTDYAALPPEKRNILRLIFCEPQMRAGQFDWEGVAQAVVAQFRIDVVRAGARAEVSDLVAELSRFSPEFEAMWRDNEVRTYADTKRLNHPILGPITFEHSAFAVDGRPDLGMIVYNPATAEDAERVRALIAEKAEASASEEVVAGGRIELPT